MKFMKRKKCTGTALHAGSLPDLRSRLAVKKENEEEILNREKEKNP